jgi:hypothetical protein
MSGVRMGLGKRDPGAAVPGVGEQASAPQPSKLRSLMGSPDTCTSPPTATCGSEAVMVAWPGHRALLSGDQATCPARLLTRFGSDSAAAFSSANTTLLLLARFLERRSLTSGRVLPGEIGSPSALGVLGGATSRSKLMGGTAVETAVRAPGDLPYRGPRAKEDLPAG